MLCLWQRQAQLEKQRQRVKDLEERLLKETRLGERLSNELFILKVHIVLPTSVRLLVTRGLNGSDWVARRLSLGLKSRLVQWAKSS